MRQLDNDLSLLLSHPIAGELIFLLTGVYITYCIRNAKKEIYREKWPLSVSIYLETVVSLATYVVRHSFWLHPDLHPDHIFLLYMVRCQLTVSPMLILLFFPKVSRTSNQRPINTDLISFSLQHSCGFTAEPIDQSTTDHVIYHQPKCPSLYLKQWNCTALYYPMGSSISETSIWRTWIPKTSE